MPRRFVKTRRENSKIVVWPRTPIDGPNGLLYRYAVVGLIVTDTPIDSLEEFQGLGGVTEAVIDGKTLLADALDKASKRQAKIRLSDASMVLTSLNDI